LGATPFVSGVYQHSRAPPPPPQSRPPSAIRPLVAIPVRPPDIDTFLPRNAPTMAWGEDEPIGPDVASVGLHISERIPATLRPWHGERTSLSAPTWPRWVFTSRSGSVVTPPRSPTWRRPLKPRATRLTPTPCTPRK
jgi:hypothetical protein